MAKERYYRFIEHYDPSTRFDRVEIAREDGKGTIVLSYDSGRLQAGTVLTDVERDDALQYVRIEEVDENGVPVEHPKDTPEVQIGPYDPAAHSVDEVREYLKTANPEEVRRVKAAEASGDRKSTQIAGFVAGGEGS